jgi:serine protease AprX
VLAAVAAALGGAGVPAAQAAAPSGEFIVQFAPGVRSASAREAIVQGVGGTVTRDVPLIDAAGARLSPADAAALRGRRDVEAVTPNGSVSPTTLVNFDPNKMSTAFNQSAKTSNLWNSATGKGVGVAVIDTGVTAGLADFRVSQTDPASRVVATAVVNPGATTPDDLYGHGTLVAGILAGDSGYRAASDTLRGKYAGAAPDANLVGVKISDDQGNATVLDAINGIQFAVDHKADYNIRVINLSFEADQPQSYATDPLDAAVESAWLHGIVVVAAAGNRGTATDAVSYAPANDPYVITVGGVDDRATKGVTDDVIASWSSRGVTEDGFSKPDVYAPGAHITANLAPGSAFMSLCPACIRDGAYIQAGGTSLAAPIVAGTVADILEDHPSWTPEMVKGALLNTTRTISGGAREIDALNAYNASSDKLVANRGLTANQVVVAGSGDIDYTKASWSKASWSKASWSKASWSCVCDTSAATSIDPTKASWSKASWSTDWTK